MNLFVFGLSRFSSKEGKDTMLIGNVDIVSLMIYVHLAKEDKWKDWEELRTKRAKTTNQVKDPECKSIIFSTKVIRACSVIS